MKFSPWHICVLVPARNEEELLPRCLDSIMVSCSALPADVTCDVIVTVDSSTDKTEAIARSMLLDKGAVLSTKVGVVGKVRAIAASTGLERYKGQIDRCWLANTDADCRVPESWLLDQLLFAETGVEALAGTVDVDDFSEHHEDVKERFRLSYRINSDGTHPHIHGANLGVRADAYLRSGGWGPLETAEDHDLWDRLGCNHAYRLSVANLRVLTSGRKLGRAPHGFAEALAAHNEVAA